MQFDNAEQQSTVVGMLIAGRFRVDFCLHDGEGLWVYNGFDTVDNIRCGLIAFECEHAESLEHVQKQHEIAAGILSNVPRLQASGTLKSGIHYLAFDVYPQQLFVCQFTEVGSALAELCKELALATRKGVSHGYPDHAFIWVANGTASIVGFGIPRPINSIDFIDDEYRLRADAIGFISLVDELLIDRTCFVTGNLESALKDLILKPLEQVELDSADKFLCDLASALELLQQNRSLS